MAEQRGFGDFGYRKSTGEYVSALEDMIDGGGAGRSGEEFEGGGILSLLANLLFSPRGSRGGQPRPRSRPSGGAGGSSPTSGGSALAVGSSPRPRSRPLPAGTLPGGMEFASEEFLQNIDPTARRTAVDIPAGPALPAAGPAMSELSSRAVPLQLGNGVSANVPSGAPEAGMLPSEALIAVSPESSAPSGMYDAPAMAAGPSMPAAQPGADARALSNVLAGEAQAMDSAPRLPSEAVMEARGMDVAVNPGEAETALNLIRNNRVRRESSAFPELVALINSRGTAAQRAELAQYLP